MLSMHGNELRKAGHALAGIIRLRQSLQIDGRPARHVIEGRPRSPGLSSLAQIFRFA